MAKLESSFKNMLIALTGVALIASASLGLVNDSTKSAIEQSELNKKESAIAAVVPGFASTKDAYKVLPENSKDSVEVYPVYNSNDEFIGNAVKSYTYKGFSGYIEIMVGFDSEGNVAGYQVLKHAETPGLGAKMQDWFRPQLDKKKSIVELIFGFEVATVERKSSVIGLSPKSNGFKVSKDGGEIDAITAATISSRAFLDAIKRASSVIEEDADGMTAATQKL